METFWTAMLSHFQETIHNRNGKVNKILFIFASISLLIALNA